MCGIAGHIALSIMDTGYPDALKCLRHRGPDAMVSWTNGQAWLGHTRLSVIDLSESANQPMHSACNRYAMVYNGEVYNYRELRLQYLNGIALKTQSDSEVLLELYVKMGSDCLPLLQGMFSFAIFDKQKGELFAARDRFGVKPFYYSIYAEGIFFASEIKALWKMGIPRVPSIAAWSGYFQQGTYAQPNTSFWENIYQIPGGHSLHYCAHKKKLEMHKWYRFEEETGLCAYNDEQEFSLHYAELLKESISLRLRSDIPTGINLSGGLDSQVLLSHVYRQLEDKNLHAFTFYTNHPDYDEWPNAKKFAKQFPRVKHHNVLLSSQDVPNLAGIMAKQQDEPFGGIPTLAYGKLFEAARDLGIRVLNDGQGIDEAWAGYDYYWQQSGSLIQGGGSATHQPSWTEKDFQKVGDAFSSPEPFSSNLQNMQYRDLFFTKLPRALRFNDRASMLHGVELREPLLDHRLVELAFAAPESFKMKNGINKFLLRKMAEKWNVYDAVTTMKQAVQTPQREWLAQELHEWAGSLIEWLAGIGNPGWFERKNLLNAWQLYLNGPKQNSFYVWQWINTSLLLQCRDQ
jgi:asparagine synthase (glutamine-hydrolysing)